MVAAGDVVLVAFPFHEGAEVTYKNRPVLVLAVHGTGVDAAVWVMMITSNARRFTHPSATDIPMPGWEDIGLASQSVIRTTRVWTAEQRDFRKHIGTVPAALLEQARETIRAALA